MAQDLFVQVQSQCIEEMHLLVLSPSLRSCVCERNSHSLNGRFSYACFPPSKALIGTT